MLRTCRQCGAPFHTFTHEVAGESTCTRCEAEQEFSVTPPSGLNAHLETWWSLLRNPSQYFRLNAPRSLPFATILLWAVIASSLGTALMIGWQHPLEAWGAHFGADEPSDLLALTMTPLLVPLRIVMQAAWLTVGLWCVGLWGQSRWKTNLYLASYADISAFFLMIPLVGPVLSLFSNISILIAGCRRTYGIGSARSSLALVTPIAGLAFIFALLTAVIAFLVVATLTGAGLALNLGDFDFLAP